MTTLDFKCGDKIFQVHMPDHASAHIWRNGVPPSDPITVHPRMFAMFRGLVIPGSVLIKISPFYYLKNGEFHVFPETTLNTTPYLATTANKVRLAVVGFNLTTEVIEVYTGNEVVFSALTPPPLPTGLPDNYFPSFLVRLRYNTLELFETDITDARFALMESAGGGGSNAWPLAEQNLLEGTNYSTVALLLATMPSGGIGYLGSRSSAEAVDVDMAGITLQGVGRGASIFTSPFLVSADDTRIEDIGVVVAGAGAYAIANSGNLTDFVDVEAEHTNVADARGMVVSAPCQLYDCRANAESTGTTARGLEVTNLASAEVHGGTFTGQGGIAYDIYADTDTVVILDWPTLTFSNIGGPGSVIGWYFDSSGNSHFVARISGVSKGWDYSSSGGLTSKTNTRLTLTDGATVPPLNVTPRSVEPTTPTQEDIYLDDGTNTASGDPGFRRWDGAAWEDIGGGAATNDLGVWLEDVSLGQKVHYSTLPLAYADAVAGDAIILESGTYTLAATFDLGKAITLKGSTQGDTIITEGTDGATLRVTMAGAILEDLTIIQTKATGTVYALRLLADCRVRNVITSLTGAATTGYGIDIGDGATVDLIDCEPQSTEATGSAIGLSVVSSSVVNIYGGRYEGDTYDIITDTSTLNLVKPVLVNGVLLSSASTVRGDYQDGTNGDIVLVGASVISGLDKATVSKVVASDGSPDALTTSAAGAVTIPVTLGLATGTTVNDIDITPANNDNALITSGGVWDHTAATAAVHGLAAGEHVLGHRGGAGRFVQQGAIGSTTSGTTPLNQYLDGANLTITFPVAFSSTPIVVTSSTSATLISTGTVTTSNFASRKLIPVASFAAVGSYIAIGT